LVVNSEPPSQCSSQSSVSTSGYRGDDEVEMLSDDTEDGDEESQASHDILSQGPAAPKSEASSDAAHLDSAERALSHGFVEEVDQIKDGHSIASETHQLLSDESAPVAVIVTTGPYRFYYSGFGRPTTQSLKDQPSSHSKGDSPNPEPDQCTSSSDDLGTQAEEDPRYGTAPSSTSSQSSMSDASTSERAVSRPHVADKRAGARIEESPSQSDAAKVALRVSSIELEEPGCDQPDKTSSGVDYIFKSTQAAASFTSSLTALSEKDEILITGSPGEVLARIEPFQGWPDYRDSPCVFFDLDRSLDTRQGTRHIEHSTTILAHEEVQTETYDAGQYIPEFEGPATQPTSDEPPEPSTRNSSCGSGYPLFCAPFHLDEHGNPRTMHLPRVCPYHQSLQAAYFHNSQNRAETHSANFDSAQLLLPSILEAAQEAPAEEALLQDNEDDETTVLTKKAVISDAVEAVSNEPVTPVSAELPSQQVKREREASDDEHEGQGWKRSRMDD
jgi:hypothetical protein